MKQQVGITTAKVIALLMISILAFCAVSSTICPSACAVNMWSKSYGGVGTEIGYGLAQTSDGGYALIGSTSSFGAGGSDFYLVKTNELGVIPEFPSWLIPTLGLAAIGFFIIEKKRLFRKH